MVRKHSERSLPVPALVFCASGGPQSATGSLCRKLSHVIARNMSSAVCGIAEACQKKCLSKFSFIIVIIQQVFDSVLHEIKAAA